MSEASNRAGSTEHARALQAIYAAVSGAVTVEEVSAALVEDSAEVLGAATAGLWVISEDGAWAELVGQRNYSEARHAYSSIPLDGRVSAPVVDALQTGEPVFLADRRAAAARYPALGAISPQRPELAIACLPLLAGDRARAALAFTFDSPCDFSSSSREFYQLLATTFGQTFARARLYEAERAARERLEILARASEALAASLDYETTLQTVVDLTLPQVADFGFFDVVEGDSDDNVRRIARAHEDPRVQGILDQTRWMRSNRTDKNLCALSSGHSGWHPYIDDAWMQDIALSPEHLEVLRGLAFCSMITVPLHYQGRLLGALTLFYARSGRHHSEAELHMAEEIARRAAAAVENARLVAELRTAYELARVADRRKDEFLAVLGHELRNPLAPMQTALELMSLNGNGELEKERQVIARQVKHLVRLVDDLLDISRVTRGIVDLEKEPVAISDVITTAVEMVSPLLEQRQHRLTVDKPDADLVVRGDRVRLAQVLSNLLTNAARYTEPGGLLSVSARQEECEVVLVVRDNGLGLAPDLLPHLFEPFVQGVRSPERSPGGLGIGLALVRSLVEMHGGSVRAESDGVDKGSSFEVRLPLSEARARTQTPLGVPVAAEQSVPLLVVDDNADAAGLMAEALRLVGYEVAVAYDGPSALRLARERRPTLALVDIGLPVMDGYQLASELRSLIGPDLRLVALTGYGLENDRTRSAEAGFEAHLVKPVQLETVTDTIAELLAIDKV